MNIINANLKFIRPLTPLKLNNVKYISIHHLMALKASPADIHSWHLQRGWVGSGYNYYIRKDGTIFTLRGLNVGSHTSGHNSNNIGIALEGNYEVETIVPELQVKSLQWLINNLQKDVLKRNVNIVGHRDLNPGNQCPGKNININELLNRKFDDLLRIGSKGNDVKEIQELLNKHGYDLLSDGIFGQLTEQAVRDFQYKNKLTVDGIVGPKTIAALKNVPVPTKEHWCEKYFDFITKEKGIKIYKKDFDKNITRAEVFVLMARMLGFKE